MDIIACTSQVLLQSEKNVDTCTLVGLQDMVQTVVGHVEEENGANGKEGNPIVIANTGTQPLPKQIADE